jgi:radical SAM superfamily enzyme YgiQ (UPF0313 family)
MLIGFVHSLYESLAIEYLSSCLKNSGHEVRLFFDPLLFKNYLISNKFLDLSFSHKKKLIQALVMAKPDIVMFSVLSDNYAWCCDIAQEIKKRIDTIVVFGGVHVTAVPARVLKNKFVDYVICGEAEGAVVEFADYLSQG